MANDKARLSLITVSRDKEDAFNQYQTLAVALESDKEATIPSPSFNVENNVGRAAAKEFPDRVTGVQVKSIGLPFKFDYPQPHELAFCAAYALGERIAPAALASQGINRQVYFSKTGVSRPDDGNYHPGIVDSGYAYPTSGDAELPSFTTGFRLSASTPVAKLLLAGCKLNTMTLEANRANRFPALSAEGISGGKMKSSIYSETLTAVLGSTEELTLSRVLQGSTAAARKASIHGLWADVDGDGIFEEAVDFSGGAVDVDNKTISFRAPYIFPDKVFYSDGASDVDYTAAAQTAGGDTVPAGLVNGQDYLYIGSRHKFDNLTMTMDTVNAVTATLTVEYWNGTSWTAVTNKIDGTLSGGATLAQPGNITWANSYTWAKHYLGEAGKKATLFWIRISASANLTASTDLSSIYMAAVMDVEKIFKYEPSTYTDLTANAKTRNTTTISLELTTSGFFYFGGPRPFEGLLFDLVGLNPVTATLAGEYWDGANWNPVALTDNTATGGKPFAVAGLNSIQWTAPTDWGNTTVGSETTERYWVRISTSAGLTTATANSVKEESRHFEVKAIYNHLESTYLAEMASDAAAYVEGNLMIAKAYVLLGGRFNGVEMEGGVPYGCELASFTFTYNNNHKDPASCWQGGGDGEYADEILRGDPECSLQVNRRLIDWLVQNDIRAGQQFKVHIELQGPTISGTSPAVPYRARIHLDRVWYEEAGISVQDGRYQEQATLRVGESDEHPAVVVVIESKDSTGFAG